jgi:tetratricopeptide (TPR) repeat protein
MLIVVLEGRMAMIQTRRRAAELRDEALFKDPPDKEDCPICFLPMPRRLICCMSLPPATILSVPIHDFAEANNEDLENEPMDIYYPCCGKSVCGGCVHSFHGFDNDKCPFCNSDRAGKTVEDEVEEMRKRVEANDPASIYLLANDYHRGLNGIQQNRAKAIELFTKSAEIGYMKAHNNLASIYHEGGNLKKAKFHFEAAAMAGNEVARFNVGVMEAQSGNLDRAIKHLRIAASAGCYQSMYALIFDFFEEGSISRESIDSTLTSYNNSCAEMRSEARDAYIQKESEAYV